YLPDNCHHIKNRTFKILSTSHSMVLIKQGWGEDFSMKRQRFQKKRMVNMSRSRSLFILMLVLLIGLMMACSKSETSGSKKVQFNLGGVINPEQVSHFDPLLATGNWENLHP